MANYCQCGCGTEIPETSKLRRPQRFAHGHNGAKRWDTMYVPEDRGYKTPCWIWQGEQSGNGHGVTKFRGRMEGAHRVSLHLAGVEIPDGFHVDHLCRVRLCINPAHLEPVTCAENVRRGDGAKLCADDVREIRAVRDQLLAESPVTVRGTKRLRVPNGDSVREQLARRYGVRSDYIKQIWRGERWSQ